jgi:hypothetical protein
MGVFIFVYLVFKLIFILCLPLVFFPFRLFFYICSNFFCVRLFVEISVLSYCIYPLFFCSLKLMPIRELIVALALLVCDLDKG